MSNYRWQAFSLVDSPNGSASIVFCRGCKFRCPYCHNPELLEFEKQDGDLNLQEIKEKILKLSHGNFTETDWLIISGGEPLNNEAYILREILKCARSIKLKTGIYTTGIYPEKIKELYYLIDYFHIDFKCNNNIDEKTIETVRFLEDKAEYLHVNFTVMKKYHSKEIIDVTKRTFNYPIGLSIRDEKRLMIFTRASNNRETLVKLENYQLYTESELKQIIF